ncbi:response regulator [Streptomyces sp. NPDC058525]|uniref:response regulator n=1 Tax=Streptomyces sp. NPDC058525 TaxID=3346538 RepID=UPI0036531823
MIKVVIVDDEALVRTGLQRILSTEGDIDVVALTTGVGAVEAVTEHGADAVLLDIRMPDVDGLTVLRRIRELPVPPAVCMLTTFDTDDHLTSALQAGAAGFLLKDTDPEHLAPMVRFIASGGIALSPRPGNTVIDGHLALHGRLPAGVPRPQLTEREHEVLGLLAEGLTNTDIAGRTYLGLGTVKEHVSAILAKLRATNRVQAALAAERSGLLANQVAEPGPERATGRRGDART